MGPHWRIVRIASLWLIAIGEISAGPGAEREHFAAVVRYWEWSAYWSPNGLDFPNASYKPGLEFSALVFYRGQTYGDAAYWGFCSRRLGVCQAYSAQADGSVDQAAGLRMRKGETASAAFRRFQRQEFQANEVAKFAEWHRAGPRLLAGLPEGESTGAGSSQLGNEEEVQVRTLFRKVRLPALRLPEAIRQRAANRFVEGFVRAQAERQCSVTVPFADHHAPLVPVLYDCPGSRGIQFMRKNEETWYETAGGWMEDGITVRQLVPRIRKYASLILKP